jgi:LPXTG-motif cell wall-anchored protein
MKMKDSLPDEMERVGGDGLTEYWEDFEPGETKTFIIRAKVNSEEYDRENFEKCVVNKAKVLYDDDEEGSDTATVCYGDSEVTELPKTGGSSVLYGALGLGLSAFGLTVKKLKK